METSKLFGEKSKITLIKGLNYQKQTFYSKDERDFLHYEKIATMQMKQDQTQKLHHVTCFLTVFLCHSQVFYCVCVVSLSFCQCLQHSHQNPLQSLKHFPPGLQPRLDVQPQSDHPEPDQDQREPAGLRAVEAAGEGCVGVRRPHTTELIFETGGDVHL